MSFHLHEVMSNTKLSGWKKAVPHQGGLRGPTRVVFFFLCGVYFRILQLILLPCSSKLVIKTVKWRSYFWFLAESHWDITPLPALSYKSVTTWVMTLDINSAVEWGRGICHSTLWRLRRESLTLNLLPTVSSYILYLLDMLFKNKNMNVSGADKPWSLNIYHPFSL